MTGRELRQYQQELRDILNGPGNSSHRAGLLKTLASKVGATKLSREPGMAGQEAELVHNINDALRTAAMILACKTANRNFWVGIVLAGIAFLSTLAAWVAIYSRPC